MPPQAPKPPSLPSIYHPAVSAATAAANLDPHGCPYPYGRRHAAEVPSWASTPSQAAADLQRAVAMAALLDVEAATLGGRCASAADARAATLATLHTLAASEPTAPGGSAAVMALLSRASADAAYPPDGGRSPSLPPRHSADAPLSALVRASPLYRALTEGDEPLPLLQQLDAALAYLRGVHAYDMYTSVQAMDAGDLRFQVGDGYRRLMPRGPGVGTGVVGAPAAAGGSGTGSGGGGGGGGDAARGSDLPPPPQEDSSVLVQGLLYGEGSGGDAGGSSAGGGGSGSAAAEDVVEPAAAAPARAAAAEEVPRRPVNIAGCTPEGHLTSERARASAQDWTRRVADRVRGRAAAAVRQAAVNFRLAAAPLPAAAFAPAPPPPPPTLPSVADGSAAGGEAATLTPLLPGQQASMPPPPAADAAAPPHTVDRLVPFTGREGGSVSVPWPLMGALAAATAAVVERAHTMLPDAVLLAHYYAQHVLPILRPEDPTAAVVPAPVPVPDSLAAKTVAGIAAGEGGGPAAGGNSLCDLCYKRFRAPVFVAKHLHNKHGRETAAALAVARDGITRGVTAAAGAVVARVLYFCDPRRPLPWQDPGAIAMLQANSVADARAQAAEVEQHGWYVVPNGGLTRAPPVGMPGGMLMHPGYPLQVFSPQGAALLTLVAGGMPGGGALLGGGGLLGAAPPGAVPLPLATVAASLGLNPDFFGPVAPPPMMMPLGGGGGGGIGGGGGDVGRGSARWDRERVLAAREGGGGVGREVAGAGGGAAPTTLVYRDRDSVRPAAGIAAVTAAAAAAAASVAPARGGSAGSGAAAGGSGAPAARPPPVINYGAALVSYDDI